MRLTELRPCQACGDRLGVTFYRVSVEHHFVNVVEVRKRHAMDVMFPGAVGIAATFHGDPDDATKVATSSTVLLCVGCYAQGNVAQAVEATDDTEDAS